MSESWVVVADHSRARIFQSDPNQKRLKQLHELDHATARSKAAAHQHSSTGAAPADKMYKEREGEQFVGNLTAFLEEEHRQHRFAHLTVVCPATFLGEFRKATSAGLQKAVTQELSKDLIHQGIKDIEKIIFN